MGLGGLWSRVCRLTLLDAENASQLALRSSKDSVPSGW